MESLVESLPSLAAEPVNILLVDDTPANMLVLESVLSKPGQRIMKASSGKEALKILLKRDFALILLDVNMPGMDGFETASLIRQRKSSEVTPIIFMTAYVDSERHRETGYSLGAVDFIFSPIVPDILQSKVAVFVELYRKTAEVKQLNVELQKHAAALEAKVRERTRELLSANEQLKSEIGERELAEKKLEAANAELLRLYKAKSDFTSMVTHELRTPLSCIKMATNLLLDEVDGPLTKKQKETLAIGKANMDRLDKLIDNVLDFSKLESGKMEMFFEDHDLKALAAEVQELMLPAAQKRGIHLSVTTPSAGLRAFCDADKFRQLLINLIDNAIKYTPKSGRVFARLFERDESIFVEVEDTGIGIKKDDCDKIFQMFVQGHDPFARKTRGSGIGLAICRKIAEQHRGALSVESAVGKGSKFTFTFPKGALPQELSTVA